MKKLIEVTEKSVVICDNPECDFEFPYNPKSKTELIWFINVACPKCGENLLTAEDYLLHKKLMDVVNFVNKWFGWLTIFYSDKKRETAMVTTHKKIDIKINKEAE